MYRSTEAGNYLRGDERLDLLYASRPIARHLLERHGTQNGFRQFTGDRCAKLQGWVNDPHRTQDIEDIRALLRANQSTLDMTEVREYFRIFDQETLLDEILSQID